MLGRKVTVEISWHLDAIPGWNHQPEDVVEMLRRELGRIEHYEPSLRLVQSSDTGEMA